MLQWIGQEDGVEKALRGAHRAIGEVDGRNTGQSQRARSLPRADVRVNARLNQAEVLCVGNALVLKTRRHEITEGARRESGGIGAGEKTA
jgi:hypothetical protein